MLSLEITSMKNKIQLQAKEAFENGALEKLNLCFQALAGIEMLEKVSNWYPTVNNPCWCRQPCAPQPPPQPWPFTPQTQPFSPNNYGTGGKPW